MKTYKEFLNEAVSPMPEFDGYIFVRATKDGKPELFLTKGTNDSKGFGVADAKLTKMGYKATGSWTASYTQAAAPRSLKKVKAGQYTKLD